jgi:hypothetical protein
MNVIERSKRQTILQGTREQLEFRKRDKERSRRLADKRKLKQEAQTLAYDDDYIDESPLSPSTHETRIRATTDAEPGTRTITDVDIKSTIPEPEDWLVVPESSTPGFLTRLMRMLGY